MADWYTAWKKALLRKGIIVPEKPWNEPILRQTLEVPQAVKFTDPNGQSEA